MAVQRQGATTRIVYNHLPRLSDEAERKLSAAVRKATFDIQGHAQQNAPVLTGHLKNSITPQIINRWHGRVTVGADYGMYVNNGTAFQPANPYWDRAIEAVAPGFEEAMRRVLGGLR